MLDSFKLRIVVLVLSVYHYHEGKAVIPTEDAIELRWDFSDCGHAGRFGPTQESCESTYKDTNLEGDVEVVSGIQLWAVPTTGLYLVTAQGPSGASSNLRQSGKGAVMTGEFHMTKGEKMMILVGQQSDFKEPQNPSRPIGGSGGTFVVRQSDQFVLVVAGGGSSGSGSKWDDWSVNADASLKPEGRNASTTQGTEGHGGVDQMGGKRGLLSPGSDSTSGGGAGYAGDGEEGALRDGLSSDRRIPRPAKSFTSKGYFDKASGVGGYFMYSDNRGRPVENNGGFGGGGAASFNGGCGGGGGYSGGGGGPLNGWGGGGGSVNNGGRQKNVASNRGKGAVIISFIGYQCCGPVVVYIAMTFIAGILFTLLLGFLIYRISKTVSKYDGKESEKWIKFKKIFRFKKSVKQTPPADKT